LGYDRWVFATLLDQAVFVETRRSSLRYFYSVSWEEIPMLETLDGYLPLAADPSTPTAVLERIHYDCTPGYRSAHKSVFKDIGKILAQNPNTPPVALALLAIFSEQFLLNPVIPLLLLENPGFWTTLSTEALEQLSRAKVYRKFSKLLGAPIISYKSGPGCGFEINEYSCGLIRVKRLSTKHFCMFFPSRTSFHSFFKSIPTWHEMLD